MDMHFLIEAGAADRFARAAQASWYARVCVVLGVTGCETALLAAEPHSRERVALMLGSPVELQGAIAGGLAHTERRREATSLPKRVQRGLLRAFVDTMGR